MMMIETHNEVGDKIGERVAIVSKGVPT
jgi:hypothetical protein